MDFQIGNPNSLWLLLVVGIALLLVSWAAVKRQQAACRFASARLRTQLLPAGSQTRHWVSAILVVASMVCLAVAAMDVRWGRTWREVPQKGIEVMFVLDVSRSMLAEDASPNRLSRAKQQINDMVDEMAGDRVGLVAFAGDTRQLVPLTSHYDNFKQRLEAAGTHSVRRGGSRLGDAIDAAAGGFLNKTNDHKAIVVFTDGEDQESEPLEVARRLYEEQGMRIFTVGLGDMDEGARIPDATGRGNFVRHEGEQVWSRMHGQILSDIATTTDGAWIPAGTKQVNMADVYHNYVANVQQQEFESARINAWIPRFQWFALPALGLLLLEVFISSRMHRAGRANKESAAGQSSSPLAA